MIIKYHAVIFTYTYLLLFLIRMQGSNEHWFLPNAPVLAYNGALRNVLDNLLEVMQQRKSLEEMESTETLVVLESVLDAVINDSCDYVSASHVHCIGFLSLAAKAVLNKPIIMPRCY